jgi:hypothetical protein
VVYWPSGFLEAWGTKAKKPHFSRNILVYWPCRQANKPVCSWKSVVFWPGYPRPPKNHLANKPLRDPSGALGGLGGSLGVVFADIELIFLVFGVLFGPMRPLLAPYGMREDLLDSIGSPSEHAEIGPESFGIGMCRSVGTVPNSGRPIRSYRGPLRGNTNYKFYLVFELI